MPISFACPKCGKNLNVPDSMAGKAAKCPCGVKLKIPAPAAAGSPAPAAAIQPAAQAASDSPQRMMVPEDPNAVNLNPDFQIQCIQCGTQYPVRPDLLGQTVACKCGAPIRFEDPLGTGGSMTTDPFKAGQMEVEGTPVAYQSLTPDENFNRRDARKKEDDVLKMYIKDEEEFDKVAKGGKTKKAKSSGGSKVASMKQESDDEGKGGFGAQILGGVGFILILGILNLCSWLFDWPIWFY